LGTPSRDPAPGVKPADRRERGRQRRRDSLYAAALALFIEKGYDSTTMDDIAERADVARTTVFNHFPRKLAFIDEWTARRREGASAALGGDDLADAPLPRVLTRFFTALSQNSQAGEAGRLETAALFGAAIHMTHFIGRTPLSEMVSRLVAHARDRGEIDEHIDPMRAGTLLVAAYVAVLSAWVAEDPAPFDLIEEIVATLDIELNGLMQRPASPADH
jgi:AcrR family transcriptional regulator